MGKVNFNDYDFILKAISYLDKIMNSKWHEWIIIKKILVICAKKDLITIK